MSSLLRRAFVPALGAALLLTGSASGQEPNTLTDAEKAEGFKLLFDGKTLDGWRGYKKDAAPGGWKVVDGAIVFDPTEKKGGDLMTKEKYSAFILKIDWKVTAGGNSGIMYHVLETNGAPYMTGPEMQVLDNKGHGDGKNPKTSAGSLYAMLPPVKDFTKPVGEWNSAVLIIKPDGHAEHWLNGEKLLEYVKGSDDWNKWVAASKFKGWKEFGKPTSGHIDLQDHGNKVEFRNIKIKVLGEIAAPVAATKVEDTKK